MDIVMRKRTGRLETDRDVSLSAGETRLDIPPKASSFPRPLLICFSHLRWDFVWQRPQHILTRAAQTYNVIMVEEPVYRPNVAPHLSITPRPGNVRIAVPVLPDAMALRDTVSHQRRMVEQLLSSEPHDSRLFWYYTPMAIPFSADLPADVCVYDNMDELSAFRGASPEIIANEEDLFARSDLVFTGGMSLFEAKRGRHAAVHAFPSSIDAAHFRAARAPSGAEPVDQAGIPHPRVGFFGVIDERMDVDLVARIATERPDLHVVMLGPVVKIDPATLPRRDNLHWLGLKRYDELPAYMAGWDAGFMPFALNESTRFISPTKTPEFLAAGLPVVSTAITDVIRPYGQAGLVEIASSAGEMLDRLDHVLARPRAPWLAEVDAFLAKGSWDRTWAAMQRLIATEFGDGAPAARVGETPVPVVVTLG